ncbi:MAG: beta-carotene 15,15'-dioxygenase, Brp/Blh family [Bacteroidia bacterium]
MLPLKFENEFTEFDYIFCGAGASASLLILELNRLDLMKDAKVLMIDKEINNKKNKTFCFWAEQFEPISNHLKELISYSWDSILDTHKNSVAIAPFSYHQISSTDLYQSIDSLFIQNNWTKIEAPINDIANDHLGPYIHIDGKRIRGKFIFDSRSPHYLNSENNQAHLYQSFFGWTIETKSNIHLSQSVRLMDFNIDQQNQTQFVYVLPYAKNKALVEVTRFGAEPIESNTSQKLLHDYITREFGDYQILENESGCIPMSQRFIEQEQMNDVIFLGAKNYNIKPSTGYAFKNMYYHAKSIAESIKNGINPIYLNKNKPDLKSRFAFYDSLLLNILLHTPEKGKSIFVRLFNQLKPQLILKFLDEKTNINEEISIFYQLKWKVFLKSLFHSFISNKNSQAFLLLFLSLLLIVIGQITTQLNTIGNIFIFLGLISIGIPHGAVDHLMGIKKNQNFPVFILKYVALFSVMLAIWIWQPLLALVVFILYSSIHFGVGDSNLFKLNGLVSFLWGLSVIAFILGTHATETNHILMNLAGINLPFTLPNSIIWIWLPYVLYRKSLSHFLTLCWLFVAGHLPLLISFFLYFIGQHSYSGWKQLQSELKLNSKKIWLHALPFHSAAWIILAVFYYYTPKPETLDFKHYTNQFFIFLSCISFPHVYFIHVFSKKNF